MVAEIFISISLQKSHYKITKAAFCTATHTGATREVQRTVLGQCGDRCPQSSGGSQCFWLPPATPPHPTQESSTEGLAEPAWEATGKVHDSAPSRLVKATHERPSGRGVVPSEPVLQSVPILRQVPSEPTWLWNPHTFTVWFSKAHLTQATDPTPTLDWEP